MIVCTFNVRGLGGIVKRRRITQLIIIKKNRFYGVTRNKNGRDFGGSLF
jgi:hypothetical protein